MKTFEDYFSHDELECKATHVVKLNPLFQAALFALRTEFDQSMTVTSCCRSKEHNKQVGGTPGSFHVYDFPQHNTNGTAAIDIKRQGEDYEYDSKLAETAWRHGFSIGIHPNFLHLDLRTATVGMPQIVFAYAGRTDPDDLKYFKELVGYVQ